MRKVLLDDHPSVRGGGSTLVGASECPLLSRLSDEAFLEFIDSILFIVSEWLIHGGAALIVGMFEGLLPSRFHCIKAVQPRGT
jgi:hypothetical protein